MKSFIKYRLGAVVFAAMMIGGIVAGMQLSKVVRESDVPDGAKEIALLCAGFGWSVLAFAAEELTTSTIARRFGGDEDI